MLTVLALKTPPGSAVLDLSCSGGLFPECFAAAGWRVDVVTEQVPTVINLEDTAPWQSAIENLFRTWRQPASVPLPQYDLISVRDILLYVDPTILESLPPRLALHGYLYVRTFAEDDPECRRHQFVPREYIEHALQGLAKLSDRECWQLTERLLPDGRCEVQPRHVIELLFQKVNVSKPGAAAGVIKRSRHLHPRLARLFALW